MKLVTISLYAITINEYKRIKYDQKSNFRKWRFTCSNSTNKHLQNMFDLLKLINKGTSAMPPAYLWKLYNI